jgi:hypothetical protein
VFKKVIATNRASKSTDIGRPWSSASMSGHGLLPPAATTSAGSEATTTCAAHGRARAGWSEAGARQVSY